MKESNALALQNQEIIIGGFTQAMLDTLKSTIAKGTTDEQFSLFLHTCIRGKLDPFLGHIDCIVYQGKDGPVMSIQHRAEAYVAVAKRDEDYEGMQCSEVKEGDVFSADFSAGTVVHKSENLFTRGKTVGAYCIAYKKGKPPMLVTVNCDQVDKFLKSSKGGQATMWKDNFDDMIVKHAIKRAFKRQFGIDIAEDEPNQNENDGAPYVRKEINPDAEPIVVEEKPKEKPKGNSRAESPKVIDAETTPVDEAIERKLVNAAIKAKLKELSITTDDDISAYMSKNMTVAGDKPTLDERKVLLTFIEAELAKKQAAFDDDLPE